MSAKTVDRDIRRRYTRRSPRSDSPLRLSNGKQFQLLLIEDADVFLHGGQIANSLIQQMATYAQPKSLSTGRLIRYAVIDGSDSARLVSAYPTAFGAKTQP